MNSSASIRYTTTTTSRGRHTHRRAQGFCTVCGSTWPCWGAALDEAKTSALRSSSDLGLPRC